MIAIFFSCKTRSGTLPFTVWDSLSVINTPLLNLRGGLNFSPKNSKFSKNSAFSFFFFHLFFLLSSLKFYIQGIEIGGLIYHIMVYQPIIEIRSSPIFRTNGNFFIFICLLFFFKFVFFYQLFLPPS